MLRQAQHERINLMAVAQRVGISLKSSRLPHAAPAFVYHKYEGKADEFFLPLSDIRPSWC
jgi:hypothetical protein